jgi:RNA polymerase sigma-70 factor (ECF subfamily)
VSRVAVRWILTWRAGRTLRRRRHENPGILAWLPARPARPDMAMDFEAALERLPDGARQIFVLHDVEGYKHEEIARLLEVSVGTSKAQLHRARSEQAAPDHGERRHRAHAIGRKCRLIPEIPTRR